MTPNLRYPIFSELARKHSGPHADTRPTDSFKAVLTVLADAREAQAGDIHPAAGVSQSNAWHVLSRMERYGIVRSWQEPRVSGRPFRFYAITDLGLRLATEIRGS